MVPVSERPKGVSGNSGKALPVQEVREVGTMSLGALTRYEHTLRDDARERFMQVHNRIKWRNQTSDYEWTVNDTVEALCAVYDDVEAGEVPEL